MSISLQLVINHQKDKVPYTVYFAIANFDERLALVKKIETRYNIKPSQTTVKKNFIKIGYPSLYDSDFANRLLDYGSRNGALDGTLLPSNIPPEAQRTLDDVWNESPE